VLPIGMGDGGRPRRTGQGGRFSTREVVLASTDRGEMPVPPHHLDPRETEVFAELYAQPVARLWEPFDRGLVALLAQVMVRIEDGGIDAWLSARQTSLQAHLFLSPRTRRAAGIRIDHVDDELPVEDDDDELPDDDEWDAELERLKRQRRP
jgi:hypothetical protein